jgi:transposase-like protein
MTCEVQNTQFDMAMELLIDNGLDGMADAISMLMNTAMQIERSRYLRAEPYERTEQRRSHANGFKPKSVKTRIGEIQLAIPQTRDGAFYPGSLERGLRSERALKIALAEMYVQGVSTRKVARITEELCGFEISSSEVSRASAELDKQLSSWRTRKLGAFPYVYLDALYEKVRHGGAVISVAVLIGVGVSLDGHREILGVSVELSENEVHWRHFLSSLQNRGLHGIRLFISDAHEGLKAARNAVFPSVPWQRCQFHLQQNAQKYVPKQHMKTEVAGRIRTIFNAPDATEAKRLLDLFLNEYQAKAPKLAEWAETALPEGLVVFLLPEGHRKKIRTVNMLERINKEIRRRTRVATLFPNTASCLRLVSAVTMEISEDWQTDKKYLVIDK